VKRLFFLCFFFLLCVDAATKKELWLQEQLSGLQERVRAGQAEILEHVRAEIDRTLPQVPFFSVPRLPW